MNIFLLLGIVYLVVPSLSFADGPETQLLNYFAEPFSFRGLIANIRNASPNERRAMLAVAQAKVGTEGWNGPAMETALLALGDPETKTKRITAFREQRVFDIAESDLLMLAIVGDPDVIVAVAEDMFDTTAPPVPPGRKPEDMGRRYSRADGTAQLVRNTLYYCPEMSPAVHLWVARLDAWNPGGMTEVLRAWWRENAAAFRARNYAAVKSGRPLSTESGGIILPGGGTERDTLPKSAESNQPPGLENSPSPPEQKSSPVKTAAAPDRRSEPGSIVWLITAGITFLLAAVVVIWRAQRGKRT